MVEHTGFEPVTSTMRIDPGGPCGAFQAAITKIFPSLNVVKNDINPTAPPGAENRILFLLNWGQIWGQEKSCKRNSR